MTMRTKLIGLIVVILVAAGAAWWLVPRETPLPKVEAAEVVRSFAHDANAFTEGLYYDNGQLVESTGEEGSSGIRRVTLDTGEVAAQQALGPPYFGEGVVGWKDKIYQLTWKDQKGFIYNAKDLSPAGEFAYKGEGWGMTHNDNAVIMSDGTAVLRFLDPNTLAQQSTLAVTANGCPVDQLNELEWIDGEIWANIWRTDLIARIDPVTGKVKSFVDVALLGPPTPSEDEVPNGIAYDSAGKRIFVTGKMWPQLYQVKVGSAAPSGSASDAAAALMRCAK